MFHNEKGSLENTLNERKGDIGVIHMYIRKHFSQPSAKYSYCKKKYTAEEYFLKIFSEDF